MDFIKAPNNVAMVGKLSLQQFPLANKQTLHQKQVSPMPQVQSLLKSQVLPFPKHPKRPRSESTKQRQVKLKLHKLDTLSKLPVQPRVQSLSKPQELFNSVRSKLRESLAAALASFDQTNNVQKDANKSPQSAGVSSSMQPSIKLPEIKVDIEVPPPQVSVSSQLSTDPQSTNSTSIAANCSNLMPENANTITASSSTNTEFNESVSVDSVSRKPVDEGKPEFAKMWACDEDFSPSDFYADDETSLLLKDDLLQSNGLCWASDLDLGNYETNEVHTAKKPKIEMKNELSPQVLATKIEEELFKIFRGVNKKYKEKGRSLLFNLRDRSNPELRERVLAGKIPPYELCSMTAEELASEELSQWRIAKAEELAHMVVLPDSEVDSRRAVVRKTHKGEFEVVEYEYDRGASVEVTLGDSSLINIPSQVTTEKVETETTERFSPDVGKPIIPAHDDQDSTQGLTVDEELKDTAFLPPIVSLDEFVESLRDEPGNAINEKTLKEENLENTVSDDDLIKSKLKEARKILRLKKAREAEMSKKRDVLKSDEGSVESKVESEVDESKDGKIWKGMIQLGISSVVSVAGYFKSGEMTPTKEWPSLLEIKGRVKIDPFKRFLKDLPLSRSRAIMVLQLSWEKNTSKSVRSKVIAQYATDERLALAEPTPGVELYLCLADSKISKALSGVLSEEHAESINAVDNGLVGIVIWRRAVPTASPKPSSHKQNSRKHHTSSSKKQQPGKKARVEESPPKTRAAPSTSKPISKLDDDVPPGFGPGTILKPQDDDDLPEFEFDQTTDSKISNPADFGGKGLLGPPPRQVQQVRDLINRYGQNKGSASPVNLLPPEVHRYGQNKASASPVNLASPVRGSGIEIKPWIEDDDDDDIPEWQPPSHEARPVSHPLPVTAAVHPYQQLSLNSSHMVSQHQQLGLQSQPQYSSRILPYPSQPARVPDQAMQQPWLRPTSSAMPSIGVATSSGQHYYSNPGQTRNDPRIYR